METISEEFKAFYEHQLETNVTLPQRIVERFSVCACLASTHQQEVYLVASKETGQKFVLKQLPLEREKANEAERALLKSLSHAGIPKAIDSFVEDGSSYLLREYFEGSTLSQLVKIRGTFSQKEIVEIAIMICDILHYLHTQNPPVIHRDVKPQNIIYTPEHAIKLIDFDISRKFDPDASQDTMFMGTSTTAPPEQFGYAQTDVRSDIYSLGVLMIYLFTSHYDRAAINSLPAGLAKIAQKCTQFAPKDRYASAAQVRRKLLALRNDFTIKLGKGAVIAICMALSFTLGRFFPVYAAAVPDVSPTFSPAPTPAVSRTVKSDAALTAVNDDGTVSFASKQIEQNARKQLGKTKGEPIMLSELQTISELCIMGDSMDYTFNSMRFEGDLATINGESVARGTIESLTDIPLFKNLSKLQLSYQRISDLIPLKGMQLTYLNIEENYISDPSPLADMQTLKNLVANNNPIRDISSLSALGRLSIISLKQTNVTDISPLAKIQSLECVDLFDTPCLDFSPMLELPRLDYINLSDSSEGDVAVVVQNKSIRAIMAHRCGLSGLDLFFEMPKLVRLDLWQNDISDLSGIDKLKNLTILGLNYTAVTDLTPLTRLKKLKELDICDVKADLKPLLQIPSLEKVRCTKDMQSQVDEIKDSATFVIEYN